MNRKEWFAIYDKNGNIVVYGSREEIREFYSVRKSLIDQSLYTLKQLEKPPTHLKYNGRMISQLYGVYYPVWLIEYYKNKRSRLLKERYALYNLSLSLVNRLDLNDSEKECVEVTLELSKHLIEQIESERIVIPLHEF